MADDATTRAADETTGDAAWAEVPATAEDRAWLADWRRRVSELYAEVRAIAAEDPVEAWDRWRAEREALYRSHPQSPVPASERDAFRALHWPYDPALRFTAPLEAPPPPAAGLDLGGGLAPIELPNSGADVLAFDRLGVVRLPFEGGDRRLAVYWMRGYSGGLFLPFRDPTNGGATYGAGRYVLDAAKGADLGGDPSSGALVVDFNFAYQPSCAFDPRWACPLAPPENRLDLPIEAGERLR